MSIATCDDLFDCKLVNGSLQSLPGCGQRQLRIGHSLLLKGSTTHAACVTKCASVSEGCCKPCQIVARMRCMGMRCMAQYAQAATGSMPSVKHVTVSSHAGTELWQALPGCQQYNLCIGHWLLLATCLPEDVSHVHFRLGQKCCKLYQGVGNMRCASGTGCCWKPACARQRCLRSCARVPWLCCPLLLLAPHSALLLGLDSGPPSGTASSLLAYMTLVFSRL